MAAGLLLPQARHAAGLRHVHLRAGAATGSVSVDDAIIQGSQALVEVMGNLCAPSSPCESNPDKSLGMPPDASAFAEIYAALSNSADTFNLSPVPCTAIVGRWYVNLGSAGA